MNVLGALLYGLANLFHPRMLWLMIWPMLIALAVWGTLALVLWSRLALWLAEILKPWIEPALGFVRLDFGDAALIAANVILFLLFVPLVYLTALFILGVFGMQKMVDHVAARSYPQLERRRGGGTAGSVGNGLVALAGMLGLFIVSLPLWLLPPLWPQPAAAALRRPGGTCRPGGNGSHLSRAARGALPPRISSRAARLRAVRRFHRAGGIRSRLHTLPPRRASRFPRHGRLSPPMAAIRTKNWRGGNAHP
jgi:hypothetical protein